MDLRERLRALNGGKPLAAAPVIRRAVDPARVLDGQEVATEHGATLVVERRYPLGHHHGARPVTALAGAAAPSLAALTGDERLRAFDARRAIILDTETTGLAGGTGTYTFLVGLGSVEADAFVVRQFFLRGPAEERALLTAVAGRLREQGGLVTYNGRTFDWPLLTTRFILARQRAALPDLPHWDVLPLARRLWRARLGSCALGALEESLLGHPRPDDTPGWLIPQLYFDYLRDGDARRLTGVFEHNRHDILALAALAGLVCQTLADPFAGAVTHGQDFLGLARHAESRGQAERAIRLYQHALTLPLPPTERAAAERALSLLYKGARRWEEATALWRALARSPDGDTVFAAIELAKYYEHVARDHERAIALVERLLAIADLRPLALDRAAARHRLARLLTRRAATRARGADE